MKNNNIVDLDLNCIRARNSLNLGKSDSKVLSHLSACAECKSSEQASNELRIDKLMPPIQKTEPDWEKFMMRMNSRSEIVLTKENARMKPDWSFPDLSIKSFALDFALLLLISFCIYFPADKNPDNAVYRKNEAMFIATSVKKFNTFIEVMSSVSHEKNSINGGNQ